MSKYSKYLSYKDSGVEWLGEIPEHWSSSRLKFLCNITTGGKDTENKIDDGQYPFYVRSQTVERINSYSYDGEAILTAGDGVGVGKVFHYVEGKFDFHQRVYMFYSFRKVIGKFLFEYIKNNFYKVALAGVAKSTVDSLRLPLIQNFMITVPPLQEQKAIATYLDRATQKIDTLIAKQSSLITLLKEKRQALISHAVTKGLNPDAKMKESGVAWLGEIPEGWEVKKLKHIGEAIIGLTYSPKDITDEAKGTLVLRSSNLQNGGLYYGDNVYVKSVIPYKLITRAGDIVICSRNGSRKLIGKNAMIDEASEGVSFGAFTSVFRSSQNPFVFYILNSSLFKYQSGRFMTTTINQLTTGTLNEFKIALPPKEEQQKITTYLDQKTQKIDTLITKAIGAITLLKEKRTALISAVVTGKVDVRGEAREGDLGQDMRGEVT